MVTISSGVNLVRCGKIRTLSIINPASLTAQTFNLPLETDYPPIEINTVGRRNSESNVGIIRITPDGFVYHMQVSGAIANFNNQCRYTATWIVE